MKNNIFILFLLSISVLLCTSCGDDEYKDSTSDATLYLIYRHLTIMEKLKFHGVALHMNIYIATPCI